MDLLNKILDHIFGRKYYANIINTRGTDSCDLCSYIFLDREAAQQHRQSLDTTLSFLYIETISFRSKKDYTKDYCLRGVTQCGTHVKG